MNIRLRNLRDLWAGLVLAVIALLFLWQSVGLQMGTAGAMGPAYMPRVLCGLILLIAALLIIRSFRFVDTSDVRLAWRPMLSILGALVAFAYSLEPLGLVGAIFLAVGISSFATKDVRPVELLIAAVFLAVLSVGVFVWLLGLNFPVWPGVLQ